MKLNVWQKRITTVACFCSMIHKGHEFASKTDRRRVHGRQPITACAERSEVINKKALWDFVEFGVKREA